MAAMHDDVIELTEYHPWRRLVFFLVGFAACAAAALAWVYTRPPQYIAVSQLRILPAGTRAEINAANAPNAPDSRVAFLTEVQVLTSRAVLQDAAIRLNEAGALPNPGPDSATALQHLLRARPIGQTQVVELSAEGRDPRFLTRLLDTVAESWRDRATRQFQQQLADENRELMKKADDVHQQTMEARARLDRFRDAHGLLATDSEAALAADLRKLGDPYSAAQASLTKAKAQMLALQSGPDPAAKAAQTDPAISDLEQQAAALRDQLRDLEHRVSPQYLRSDADSKKLLERLAVLDTQIAARREELRAAGAQLQASQSHFARLSSDISLMKKIVADFVATRPEYEALQGDLDRAEKLETSMLEAVAKSQAGQAERAAPRLDILQKAQSTAVPVRPNYALNASIALMASLGIGLLAAFFSTFLDRPAIAWSAAAHWSISDPASITYRADALHQGLQIKLLPAPNLD